MQNLPRRKKVENEALQSRDREQPEETTIKPRIKFKTFEERIECEIATIFRVRPQDVAAFKQSLEDWAAQWE